jgi:membrane-associated phospholipid phosphatase
MVYASAGSLSDAFPTCKIASVERIYNGVHYPTDVFGGMFMGLMWGSLFSFLVRRLQARVAARQVQP